MYSRHFYFCAKKKNYVLGKQYTSPNFIKKKTYDLNVHTKNTKIDKN